MKRSFFVMFLAVVALIVTLPGESPEVAGAQETTTLRLATLAPRGSPWDRAFRAWANSLRQETNGRLRLQFYLGGSQGDERDYIRKMQAGQLDGAAVTATGLGQIVRPVLVLSAPGIFREYRQIDRVRNALDDQFDGQFAESGYKLMGWGDVGRARIFSNRPIQRPQDLRSVRPWAWREDVIFTEFLSVVGANPQRLGVNEVLPALQTRRVDAFPASALAAVSLQWYNHATHVTQQSDSILVGATIIKKDKYDALPEDLRAALDSTAERAHRVLSSTIRRADDRAYEAIIRRGVTAVDISGHRAEWEQAARRTRQNLAGRLYSRELLQQVERTAGR
jgi:TRAP-type C4-dicarboxylate transport system substrate-binding protein